MDQKPASLARIQIQFYISQIARRDHKITLLQEAITKLKNTLSEKQSVIQEYEKILGNDHSRKSKRSIDRSSLKQKEDTIIGLMTQVNRQRQAKLVIKHQLDLLEQQAQARFLQQEKRVASAEQELYSCRKKLRSYQTQHRSSKSSFQPLKQKNQNKIKAIDVKYKPSAMRQRLVTAQDQIIIENIPRRKQSFNIIIDEAKRVKTQQPSYQKKIVNNSKQKNVSLLLKKASISYDCRQQTGRSKLAPRKSQVLCRQGGLSKRPFK